MTRRLPASWLFIAALAVSSTFAEAAEAHEVGRPPPSDRIQSAGPNRALLQSGLWTLGLSYLPAAIVAVKSPHPVDDNLLIPVAGPWLDYANRDCPTCSHETANKVLLVTDGLFQSLGALQIVGSFLFPETRPMRVSAKKAAKTSSSSLRLTKLTPARFETGAYGLAARGSF